LPAPTREVDDEDNNKDGKPMSHATNPQNRFPSTLHYALTDCPVEDIICWNADGRGFRIIDKERLEKEFIPM